MSINKYIPIILVALLIPSVSFALYTGENAPKADAQKPTRLIVKFKDAARGKVNSFLARSMDSAMPDFESLNKKFDISKIIPLASPNLSFSLTSKFSGILILSTNGTTDLNAIQAEYESLPDVEYAEPDYMAEFYDSPSDSLYSQQWGLNNTGQPHYHIKRIDGANNDQLITVSGIPDADIDADEIYQSPPDNTSAVVAAIIDTGADILHPDLKDNIWTNSREIPDNGLDDDNNGYIDDIHGWDFCGNGGFGSSEDAGDNDPTDEDGHGTHCAGIVAGIANNGIGIAGVNGKCKIMPLKIAPLPLTSYIAGALIYAADNGADVVNMSFGFTFRSHLIEDALDYARSKGVILCAASGNDFTERLNYPAGYPSVITVGASTDSDMVATFSTYGDHIDVIAPGHSILSLKADGTDMYASSYPREPKVHIIDSIYYLASGTSMACPHIVGVASWLRAVSPGLIPDEADAIIKASADDIIDPYGVDWNLPGKDIYSGYGRANLHNALKIIPKIRAIIDYPYSNSILNGDVEISGLADGLGFSNHILEYGEGDYPSDWNIIHESSMPITNGVLAKWNTLGLSGRYTLRLRVGTVNMVSIPVYVSNETGIMIQSPDDHDTLSTSISISGNAYCPDFGYLLLEYGLGANPIQWDTLAYLTTPVFRATIAGLIVEEIPEGEYTIRLSVYSKSGFVGENSIMVYIRSIYSTERAWKIKLNTDPTIIPNYGDFDNDGAFEIIVGTSAGVKFYSTNGTAKTEGMPYFPENNYTIPIAVGNLDNDEIDDIVAIGYDPPKLYGFPSSEPPFENYLGILPGISTNLLTESEMPKVFLKDIDGDNRDEIHVFIYDYNLSKTFIFESDGSLMTTLNYSGGYLPADLNGDGMDEIYVSSEGFGLLREMEPSKFAVTDSLLIQKDGSIFYCMDLSACDIDGDLKMELIAFGYFSDYGYWLYAFNENFSLMPGWPRSINTDNFVVPTTPIFGDIDADGEVEYFTTYFDFGTSYVLAWNLDGSSYLPSSASGLFAVVPGPSIFNMLLLADINADKFPELLGCAINDVFLNYEVQRIYGWDKNGQLLDQFPIIGQMSNSTYLRYTPVIGDISHDGNVDIIMTTADSSLVFVNFPGNAYDPCTSPAPFWRYGRNMDNTADFVEPCGQTGSGNNNRTPDEYILKQNFPNPFNGITRIKYSMPSGGNISINIYNLLGQKVQEIFHGYAAIGNHEALWDGKNALGQEMPSGIYFYNIRGENFSDSKKMIILK
jgi:subtilisin family serine protease